MAAMSYGMLKSTARTCSYLLPRHLPPHSKFLNSNLKHILNINRPFFASPFFLSDKDMIRVTFESYDGKQKYTVSGKEDSSLLDLVTDHLQDEFDGYGTCGGSVSCSSCHVILSEKDFRHPNFSVTADEQELLDMAPGLEKTSRLGCQVRISKDLDGMVVRVGPDKEPEAVKKQEERVQ